MRFPNVRARPVTGHVGLPSYRCAGAPVDEHHGGPRVEPLVNSPVVRGPLLRHFRILGHGTPSGRAAAPCRRPRPGGSTAGPRTALQHLRHGAGQLIPTAGNRRTAKALSAPAPSVPVPSEELQDTGASPAAPSSWTPSSCRTRRPEQLVIGVHRPRPEPGVEQPEGRDGHPARGEKGVHDQPSTSHWGGRGGRTAPSGSHPHSSWMSRSPSRVSHWSTSVMVSTAGEHRGVPPWPPPGCAISSAHILRTRPSTRPRCRRVSPTGWPLWWCGR